MESSNDNFSTEITCLTSYSYKIHLTPSQRHALLVLDIAVMVLNLVTNSAVLMALFMSKPYKNTSYMLLFYLSVSDCLSSLVTQPLYAILIGQYFDQSYCSFEIICQFFGVFSPHTSGYAIVAIAFDRYARMRFLNRYQLVVTKRKVLVTCLIITIFSSCEGLLYALGTKFNFLEISKNVIHVIDFAVFMSVVIVYLLTIRVVRVHRKNSLNKTILQNTDRTITVLASKILITIVLLYGFYTFVAVAYEVFIDKVENGWKSWFNFALLVAYLLTYVNSFANALLFLTMNKKSKEKITQFFNVFIFRKWCKQPGLRRQSTTSNKVSVIFLKPQSP